MRGIVFSRWAAVAVMAITLWAIATDAHASKTMSLTDDIQMSVFIDPIPIAERTKVAKLSPDGRYLLWTTERGLIKENLPEDTIWLVKTSEVDGYLRDRASRALPKVAPLVRMTTYKDGSIISDVRWGDDSSEVYFLATASNGNRQLLKSNLDGVINALTPDSQNVNGYDVRNDEVVYFATSAAVTEQIAKVRRMGGFVSIQSFPDILEPEFDLHHSLLSEVWVARSNKRTRVDDQTTHMPIQVMASFVTQYGSLKDPAISPDGRYVVVPMPVSVIPKDWEQYRAQYQKVGGIKSGMQDALSQRQAPWLIESYSIIDLSTGHSEQLVNAPAGATAWYNGKADTAAWSSNGRLIALPSTFLPIDPSNTNSQSERAQHPCLVIYDVAKRSAQCVLELNKPGNEKDGLIFDKIRFAEADNILDISLYHYGHDDASTDDITYRRGENGTWVLDDSWQDVNGRRPSFKLVVKQDLNVAPKLFAISLDEKVSKIIWNPNPEIDSMDIGEASVFNWKDSMGRPWDGGLVLPPDYIRGKRYPLIIQTHGFDRHAFMTSGTWTTNYAARELAADGFVVLQVGDLRYDSFTAHDLESDVAGYEGAIKGLSQKGIVDPDRIAIAGFSRTFLDVMQILTFGKINIRAASVADGTTGGYLEYVLQDVSDYAGGMRIQAKEYFGAAPYGLGLNAWFAKSPAFNLDRVSAPVLIIDRGLQSVIENWEIYSGLAFLHKPVENLALGEGTHPFTNPGQRLASQGATIDWFRFWLQGYQDPDPAKAEQYQRWEKLCDLQMTANPDKQVFCVGMKR
jgi:dipeptidyl aminopeptidase/acylaminoacyl peptidase